MPCIKIKDLNPANGFNTFCGGFDHYEEYINLLLNAVKVNKKDGAPLDYPTETFIKKALFENGAVGYDKLSEDFYLVGGEGLDAKGMPKRLIFYTADGRALFKRKASYTDDKNGAHIIYALPNRNGVTMAEIIREATDFMNACDVAIAQNLEACKTPYVVVCKNKDLMLSFTQALQAKENGQAVVVVNEELGDGLKAVNIDVEYLADKYREMMNETRDNLLNRFGIMTANTDKKERVQGAEVNATIGQATDYIYMLIDTFNKQMEAYALPYEMALNGALEEIYLDEGTDPNGEATEYDVDDAERITNTNE